MPHRSPGSCHRSSSPRAHRGVFPSPARRQGKSGRRRRCLPAGSGDAQAGRVRRGDSHGRTRARWSAEHPSRSGSSPAKAERRCAGPRAESESRRKRGIGRSGWSLPVTWRPIRTPSQDRAAGPAGNVTRQGDQHPPLNRQPRPIVERADHTRPPLPSGRRARAQCQPPPRNRKRYRRAREENPTPSPRHSDKAAGTHAPFVRA